MGARYSRQTGYTITAKKQARNVYRAPQKSLKFGPTTAKIFGIVALAILAIVMVSQSNGRQTNVYTQNDLNKQQSAVQQDIDRLKLEAKRAQSLQSVQNTAIKDSMEPIKDVQYVEKGDVAGVATDR